MDVKPYIVWTSQDLIKDSVIENGPVLLGDLMSQPVAYIPGGSYSYLAYPVPTTVAVFVSIRYYQPFIFQYQPFIFQYQRRSTFRGTRNSLAITDIMQER